MRKDGIVCWIKRVAITVSHKNEKQISDFVVRDIPMKQACLSSQKNSRNNSVRLQITVQSNQWAYPYAEFYGYGHPRLWNLARTAMMEMVNDFEGDPFWHMLLEEKLEKVRGRVLDILNQTRCWGNGRTWISGLEEKHGNPYGYCAELTKDAYVRYLLRRGWVEGEIPAVEYKDLVMPDLTK
jgi:hypothetical protein